MFLSTKEIEATTSWLLENASPPVQYLTHKYILKTDLQSDSMVALWNCVETGSDAESIFATQAEDGTWFSGGPWGPRGYRQQSGRGYTVSRPKFVTTAWILPFLGKMGFTAADERIRRSCEHIIQEAPHSIPEEPSCSKNCCGLYAVPLRALASVGMASDERICGEWDRLVACQRVDGGWLNPNHLADSPTPSKTQGRWPWDRSCVWGSFYAAQALYYSGMSDCRQALSAGLSFLLWHLSQQDMSHIQTWVYHGHNIVKELLMFSEAGRDMSIQPIRVLLEWLRGYYRADEGVFRTQEKPIPDFTRQVSAIIKDFENHHGAAYWENIAKVSSPVLRYHLYHLVEDDWLTYTLTRIALNLEH